jgi:hypothetical protein
MDPNSWQIGTAARTVPLAITQNGPSKEQCKCENQVCSDTEWKDVQVQEPLKALPSV